MAELDWMDKPVAEVEDAEAQRLTAAQEWRLTNLTKLLREDLASLEQLVEIKKHLRGEDDDIALAKELWAEFSEEEQTSLWVAPLYGGIFTTKERKLIKEA